MNDLHFLAALGIAGIVVGAGMFVLVQDKSQPTYCERVEAGLEANRTFNGSLTCYAPSIDTNNDSLIRNATELRCICENVFNGNTYRFEIREGR
jgi:hypothetical protein